MATNVHQFFVPFHRTQTIVMPQGARVLHIEPRGMDWHLHVDMPDDPTTWTWVSHELTCFRPEEYIREFDAWQYIGAIREPERKQWWHVFIRELTSA